MRTLLCILLTLFLGAVHAQTITISGTVVNERNKPIENVNVYLEESFDGALSDAKGYFTFTVNDTVVKDVLKLMHPQYGNMDVYIDTKEDYTNSFVMSGQDDLLGEIVVIAKSKNKRERAESIGLNAMDVVSTAGSPGNIIGVLSTMPGAQTNGEDGRLLIRGGKADESGIYVNGIKVFQPYTASVGNVPVRSKFNPFLFKGMSFSAGGYSAEFGDALSGVLQLDTSDDIDPSRKDISISTVGVSFGQTHQWGKNSLSYSLNYLNLGAYTALVKQRYNSKKPFNTASAEVVYKREVKDGGYKLYTAVDLTSIKYEQEIEPSNRVDTLAFKSNNVYMNSLYFKKLSPYMRLDVGTGLGYSDYKGDSNEKHIGRKNWDLNQKVKLSYQWNSKWQSFIGADVQVAQLDLTRSIGKYSTNNETDATRFALFFENNWNIGSGLSLRAGVRVNKYSAISDWTIEPRTMLTYQMDTKQQVSLSYGVFNQALNLEQAISLKQEDWMQADHYIFNYTYEFKKRMLRAEVFYKDYSKLLLTPMGKTSEYSQLGEGYAKGFDVFWKDSNTFKNFNYWITYTYIDSKRKEMYWDEWVQPSYVAKHNFSVVTKYWIEQWKSQVSMTYNFTTPRHFYNTDATDKVAYKSSQIHNVSMSWAYLLSAQKILYASVDNLLGRNPVYAYQFTQQGGQPDVINPTAKRFVYIGFMWTISSNKKSNQLDNL
ncbi:TonB-dependent receptor [Myroides marinus]|uniref:TonB-dependent receptor n=1 Tax=Myroides marinus TaxID=703342 RepID=UPI0025776EA0|nr:TonB-dependent receptor [Myroides marinus]MDM1361132.1 TonB-dependent receptor [Myroides marinus]MDM1368153.1 TonB-dependent receptor [Myroides marinus]MDM1372167.1 TonB-dependent receptor [Myroides marinus]MDM1375096.1 TonB-dependent receptor [Myroides marinus]MDM1383267.1 TonB-dependent receptor [Myroides marinus]